MKQKSPGKFHILHSDILRSKTRPELGRRVQNLKWRGLFVVVLALALSGAVAQAQQAVKTTRIGILMSGSLAPRQAVLDALREGLRDLGYVERKNLAFEYRFSEGKDERLPELAAELVREKVDIIVTSGIPPPLAAKNATKTIPIVMGVVGDAVGTGLVDSLARPGGNVTGLTLLGPELGGKRLEILKETVPKLARVAVLLNPANRGTALYRKEIELAAKSLGVELHILEASRPNALASALSKTKTARVQALFTLNDTMFFSEQVQIAKLAIKTGLPAMFPESEYVNAGGLMSYGPNLPDLFRRTATYIDKILKGTKPADLPVEQPKKFEFVINLKTAKQIGLTIPPNVLARADRVIK
jgi:putative ABC transport system substrate-binding protein